MAASWKHADMFPLVAEVIRETHAKQGRIVTHDEITAGLLTHPTAIRMIEEARGRLRPVRH